MHMMQRSCLACGGRVSLHVFSSRVLLLDLHDALDQGLTGRC
jgi:hypothetical protein